MPKYAKQNRGCQGNGDKDQRITSGRALAIQLSTNAGTKTNENVYILELGSALSSFRLRIL